MTLLIIMVSMMSSMITWPNRGKHDDLLDDLGDNHTKHNELLDDLVNNHGKHEELLDDLGDNHSKHDELLDDLVDNHCKHDELWLGRQPRGSMMLPLLSNDANFKVETSAPIGVWKCNFPFFMK